jgi:hypothetical protein
VYVFGEAHSDNGDDHDGGDADDAPCVKIQLSL